MEHGEGRELGIEEGMDRLDDGTMKRSMIRLAQDTGEACRWSFATEKRIPWRSRKIILA